MKIKIENREICDTIVSIRRICYMDIEQNFNRLFQQKEGDKALLLLGIYNEPIKPHNKRRRIKV